MLYFFLLFIYVHPSILDGLNQSFFDFSLHTLYNVKGMLIYRHAYIRYDVVYLLACFLVNHFSNFLSDFLNTNNSSWYKHKSVKCFALHKGCNSQLLQLCTNCFTASYLTPLIIMLTSFIGFYIVIVRRKICYCLIEYIKGIFFVAPLFCHLLVTEKTRISVHSQYMPTYN